MILTYKYRIKDRSARKTLLRHAYGVNQVWNWCCAQQRDVQDRFRAGAPKRTWRTRFEISRDCAGVGELLNIGQQTVNGVCRYFVKCRSKIRRAPGFRLSFGSKKSRGWVPFERQNRKIEGNSIIYLGKRYRWFGSASRPLPENASGGCFVEDSAGKWWVCFYVDGLRKNSRSNESAVGIDLGLKSFATLSDARKIEPPKFYQSAARLLGAASRARRWKKVRSINAHIRNQRRDFLQKLSTSLARDYAFIAVGNVKACVLARGAMAKSVLDASWSSFRTMLAYKAEVYVEVDERLTTQACSGCGSIAGPKGRVGLNKRDWQCSGCGEHHDRDVNAAKNILARAQSTLRPVEGSRQLAVVSNRIKCETTITRPPGGGLSAFYT